MGCTWGKQGQMVSMDVPYTPHTHWVPLTHPFNGSSALTCASCLTLALPPQTLLAKGSNSCQKPLWSALISLTAPGAGLSVVHKADMNLLSVLWSLSSCNYQIPEWSLVAPPVWPQEREAPSFPKRAFSTMVTPSPKSFLWLLQTPHLA